MASSTFMLSVILSIIGYVCYSLIRARELPKHYPWVGVPAGWQGKARANLLELLNGKKMVTEGYMKYSKHNQDFIAPSITFEPRVFLPPEQAKWIDDQPESILNSSLPKADSVGLQYTSSMKLHNDLLHGRVIRTHLTRRLGDVLPDMVDELIASLQHAWGTDCENWKEVNLYNSMQYVTTRTSNRLFVGQPLCHDEGYLAAAGAFSFSFAAQGAIISMLVPRPLQPIFGPILGLPVHYRHWRLVRYLKPMLEERLQTMQQDPKSPLPDDLTQWLISEALQHPDPTERQVPTLAGRLALTNFTAIHTSTFTATHVILDLISSPHVERYYERIRQEADTVLGSTDFTQWNKATVARLVYTDSALRESQRINSPTGRTLARIVMPKEGLTLPSGAHVVKGTYLAVAGGAGVHMDPDIYENPEEFQAFRFADEKEKLSGEADIESYLSNKTENVLKSRKMNFVTTSPKYLTFGHGKHACPGRFFAAQETKVLLAYIAQNYEIKPLQTRPKNLEISDAQAPPTNAIIQVRRRKSSSS